MEALRLVTDLTNEPLVDLADLRRRCAESDMLLDAEAEADDVDAVRELVARWTEIVDADTEQRRVDLLNALLAETAAYPRITDHDGSGWHLHYRDDGVSLAVVLTVLVAMAAARHLTDLGMHRLGRCALAECGAALVDVSRGGRQRYCSRVCANRDAVRRHRGRAQESTTGSVSTA
ncbi:CGNR zinc finger domain-containing protein [Herbihabitans rhizosphaerae]|uniref:CGNR zinc finger domain-containing protein n=1 Tax=Herbihabitans rhizosphaerae TaxID=1872711 RepID=UPI001F5FF4D4|nr:CGNR zinc finger domain-containing protein [Herbihabitans rhizosphaerae]